MSKLSLNINLNAFEDANATNNPMQNVIRWARQVGAVQVSEPQDRILNLAPKSRANLITGVVDTEQDNTTEYSLKLKLGNTYTLKFVAGTEPKFRESYATDADDTTELQVTKNGPLVKVSHISGTDPDFDGNLVAGVHVRMLAPFAPSNQGTFKVLSVGADYFTFENPNATDEDVVLGMEYDDILRFFGAIGVQIGDKLSLPQDFSLASGVYEITYVQDNLIEFYSSQTLPEFDSVQQEIVVYNSAKKFVYLETSKKVSLYINGAKYSVSPVFSAGVTVPGIFLLTDTIYSLLVENETEEPAQIYLASAE